MILREALLLVGKMCIFADVYAPVVRLLRCGRHTLVKEPFTFKSFIMKRQITLALFAFVCLLCAGKSGGVWISSTDEGYYKLKLCLDSKSVRTPDGTETCYGYLQMENDFVADYWIVTAAEQLRANTFRVKYYSLRYGLPGQDETADVTFNPSDGSVSFGEAYKFTAGMAAKYVEVLENNVNLLSSAVNGTPVAMALRGMMFALDGMEGGWYRLRLAGGKVGYVADGKADAVAECAVPAEAFDLNGNIMDADKMGNTTVSFAKAGGVVSMFMEYSRVFDEAKGQVRWQYTTRYSGRVEGNALVFDRKVRYGVGNFELENATPDQMEAIEPVIVYYSPTLYDFIIDGKPLHGEERM